MYMIPLLWTQHTISLIFNQDFPVASRIFLLCKFKKNKRLFLIKCLSLPTIIFICQKHYENEHLKYCENGKNTRNGSFTSADASKLLDKK